MARKTTPLHREPREDLEGAFDWDPSRPLREQWPWNGATRQQPEHEDLLGGDELRPSGVEAAVETGPDADAEQDQTVEYAPGRVVCADTIEAQERRFIIVSCIQGEPSTPRSVPGLSSWGTREDAEQALSDIADEPGHPDPDDFTVVLAP